MSMVVKLYTWLLLLLCSYSYGQMEEYAYKRELKGVSEGWHTIVLPKDIFSKVAPHLSDLRVFGVTANKDTVEAPYLLRVRSEKISRKEVAFKLLNTSHNDKGYYFTFEIPTTEAINQIKLEFSQQNFDWRVNLEGSHNQQEWFTVSENYRILSIKNEMTDFKFNKLVFPSSKYRFFRMHIDSKEKPDLVVTSIAQNEIIDGVFRNYAIKKTDIKENKPFKQTEIDIELQLAVPVSEIKIAIADSYDYYRPVTIKYLADSLKTEKGWIYNYRTLVSGTLNSMEENEFKFSSRTLQKLKILIHNQDNQSLTFDSVKIKGYSHELVARFTEPATYFLAYGNPRIAKPTYDIKQFEDKIPATLTTLDLGKEVSIEKPELLKTAPLFKNKNWLWIIMTVLILLLGWFSVKMIRKN